MLNRLKNTRVATCCAAIVFGLTAWPAAGQQVIVLGSPDDVIGWLQAENWWGEEKHGEQLTVPNAMITGISPRWRENAQKLPVAQKKEIFYRFMLPLVMHANTMVLDRRARLTRMVDTLEDDGKLQTADLEWLREAVVLLRITNKDNAVALDGQSPEELRKVIDQALYRLDVIPAGLVLGQAAYESGYGTSRFAAEGNALFGQWTFGGKGLVPEQQRSNLGDHRIAAFEWPFDSVRGYFINLSSHPAYEDFRRLRADLKAAGKPVTSLALADGLIRYSERGQAYVDTLKGIIRVNKLDIADDAVFRDEPMSFLVSAENETAALKLREEIEALRKSGELATIIARMRLE
jgi:Bax protein